MACAFLKFVTLFVIFVRECHAYSQEAVFESIERPPIGWTYLSAASLDESITLNFHLRQDHKYKHFEQLLLNISTPGHPSYAQFISQSEIARILSPSQQSTKAVHRYIATQELEIAEINDHGDHVEISTTVRIANKLLKSEFLWYWNKEREVAALRTLEYSLPTALHQHIAFVEPTIKFPATKPLGLQVFTQSDHSDGYGSPPPARCSSNDTFPGGIPKSCCTSITPDCLLRLYDVFYTADPENGNKAAFTSFIGQHATHPDLERFEQVLAPYTVGANFTTEIISPYSKILREYGGTGEGNLDVQYLLSLSYPTPITEYITGGTGDIISPNKTKIPVSKYANEPYMKFLNAILALPDEDLPQVISISYAEDEKTWPQNQATKVCNMFAQLGARGVSVLSGSGDSGPGIFCVNNANTTLQFTPLFPASCPWITSVGATQYMFPEQGTSYSGGGFSNYFPRPSYQADVIPPFLRRIGTKNQGYYNPLGRGIPDVAAQGSHFNIYSYDYDFSEQVLGTSASTPTFAALVALLNSARISAGNPPLGFLNPFLYGVGAGGLTDITSGNSVGCGSYEGITPGIPNAHWPSVKGWDPVTGLGTPMFGALLNLTAPGACNAEGPWGKNPNNVTC